MAIIIGDNASDRAKVGAALRSLTATPALRLRGSSPLTSLRPP